MVYRVTSTVGYSHEQSRRVRRPTITKNFERQQIRCGHRAEIENELGDANGQHALPQKNERARDEPRIGAAEIGLPVKEGRALTLQNVPGHQRHHRLVGVEGKGIERQQRRFERNRREQRAHNPCVVTRK